MIHPFDEMKLCRPGAMVIRRLPPSITESPEKLSAGAGGAAKLAGGARLTAFFAAFSSSRPTVL